MLIIPAIDLKDGKVVRLVQGRYGKKTYSSDPVKTAKHWIRQGAQFLHIVDLDGATQGTLKHIDMVKKIIKAIDIPAEFGGGVRDKKTIKQLLNCGIDRVVLGSKASDFNFLRDVKEAFKDRIIISIDATGNKVLVKGWKDAMGKFEPIDLAIKLKEIGFNKIIYTDISRDGTLKGPNIRTIKNIFKETGLAVIASGGIASLDDLSKLKLLKKQGLIGVIIGTALYEGRFTLKQAIACVK